jgi:hypothetical protein
MANTNGNSTWVIVLIVLGIAMFLNALGGGNSGGTTSSSPSVDRSSFEHRYATERFKQEGYSAAESQQAADAVIKFNEAQRARSR